MAAGRAAMLRAVSPVLQPACSCGMRHCRECDVAGIECGSQLGFDVKFEYLFVEGGVDNPWGSQTVASQSRNEGLCFPRPKRVGGTITFTTGCPAGSFGQLGIGR